MRRLLPFPAIREPLPGAGSHIALGRGAGGEVRDSAPAWTSSRNCTTRVAAVRCSARDAAYGAGWRGTGPPWGHPLATRPCAPCVLRRWPFLFPRVRARPMRVRAHRRSSRSTPGGCRPARRGVPRGQGRTGRVTLQRRAHRPSAHEAPAHVAHEASRPSGRECPLGGGQAVLSRFPARIAPGLGLTPVGNGIGGADASVPPKGFGCGDRLLALRRYTADGRQ